MSNLGLAGYSPKIYHIRPSHGRFLFFKSEQLMKKCKPVIRRKNPFFQFDTKRVNTRVNIKKFSKRRKP